MVIGVWICCVYVWEGEQQQQKSVLTLTKIIIIQTKNTKEVLESQINHFKSTVTTYLLCDLGQITS